MRAEGNRLQAAAAPAGTSAAAGEPDASQPAAYRTAEVTAADGEDSFRTGCIGILVRNGSHVKAEAVRVRPLCCPRK